jgi:pyridoxamine 5'-phosphate oxidase family protein
MRKRITNRINLADWNEPHIYHPTWPPLSAGRSRPFLAGTGGRRVRRGTTTTLCKQTPTSQPGRTETTTMFSDKETEYLKSQPIGRLATVTANGRAHVVPIGFRVSDDGTAIELGGHKLADRRPLYLRNIETNPWVALVVDDLGSTDPWTPRGVTVRGRAEIQAEGGERIGPGFDPLMIVITPATISSWGIDSASFGPPRSRKVG